MELRFLKTIESFLLRFGKWATRTPEEAKASVSTANTVQKVGIFVFFTLLALGLVGTAIWRDSQKWENLTANVSIRHLPWHVIYHDTAAVRCEEINKGVHNQCPANPDHSELWKSSFLRSDPEHHRRRAERAGSSFWLGTVIPVEVLKEAKTNNSPHLLLGWLYGTYKIFIDGVLADDGSHFEGTASIRIPPEVFTNGKPLAVAVELRPLEKHPFPDYFFPKQIHEGFYTSARSHGTSLFSTYFSYTFPSMFFAANILLGFLALALWATNTIRREYFFLSIYCMINAIAQITLLDPVRFAFLPDQLILFRSITRSLSSGSAILLALSLARAQRKLFYGALGLVLARIPISVLPQFSSLKSFSGPILQYHDNWLTPLFLTLSGFVCLNQGYYLQRGSIGTQVWNRVRQLYVFGTSFLIFGILYYFEITGANNSTDALPLYRVAHLGVVAIMFVALLREYKSQESLLRKTPVSEYHRRPELPESVTGALLIADLKNSESLYKLRADQGTETDIVSEWRNEFYLAAAENEGVVLAKKGDELICLFDKSKDPDPVTSALKTVQSMVVRSSALQKKYGFELNFRGAITLGDVRPIWENVGTNREPYWVDAGKSNAFVMLARLIELERPLSTLDQNTSTKIVVPEGLVPDVLKANPALSKAFTVRSRPLQDKHGTTHLIACFDLKALSSISLAQGNRVG